MKLVKFLLFFVCFGLGSLRSQVVLPTTENGVGFFEMPVNPDRVVQDSFYFFNADTVSVMGLFGDYAYINAALNFVNNPTYNIAMNYGNFRDRTQNCVGMIGDKKFGYFFSVASTVLETTDLTKLNGAHYFSLENSLNRQIIYKRSDMVVKELNIKNLQINNEKGVDVLNTGLKLGNNMNLVVGAVKLRTHDLELMGSDNESFFSCFNLKSYIITDNETKILKNNVVTRVTPEVPLGVDEHPVIIKPYLNSLVPGLNKLGFNLSAISSNVADRIDESLGLMWTVSNEGSNLNLKFDSMKAYVPKTILDARGRTTNFYKNSAFISQFVGNTTLYNLVGGDTSFSNWDKIKNTSFNPPTNTSPVTDGLSADWGMYLRKENMLLDKLNVQYAITNLNFTPLTTKIITWMYNFDPVNCNLELIWRPTDMYYSGLNFGVYVTNSNDKEPSNLNGEFRIMPSYTNLVKDQFVYNNINGATISTIVDMKKDVYVKMFQQDVAGKRIYTDYKKVPLTCNAYTTAVGSKTDPLIYVQVVGGVVYLHVEFKASYSEAINVRIFNVLGELEADMGSYTIHNNTNNLILQLPSHLSRNQRYIIFVSGGTLNESLVRNSSSVFIP